MNNKTLMVFGKKIRVKETTLDEATMGLYKHSQSEIQIKKDSEDMMHTLIHELGHAICCRGSLQQAISPELEEILVDQFATVITENFNLEFKK